MSKFTEFVQSPTELAAYVLDISYESCTIVTNDELKSNLHGLPRNAILVARSTKLSNELVILQIRDTASVPLKNEIDMQYMEMHKSAKFDSDSSSNSSSLSSPPLDTITKSELHWSAANCDILGVIYERESDGKLEFAHDIRSFSMPLDYKIYVPPPEIIDLLLNSFVGYSGSGNSSGSDAAGGATAFTNDTFEIGTWRESENRNYKYNNSDYNENENENNNNNKEPKKVPIMISPSDFVGSRTALFGKTRTGKSNTVKIIAESIIKTRPDVGQLIFDVNGEYANTNTQDGMSLYDRYADRCRVYAFHNFTNGRRPLKIDFFEYPDKSKLIVSELLQGTSDAHYVKAFATVDIPSLKEYEEATVPGNNNASSSLTSTSTTEATEASRFSAQVRAGRRILIYWSILYRAGFHPSDTDAEKMRDMYDKRCRMSERVRRGIYSHFDRPMPTTLETVEDMAEEWTLIAKFVADDNAQEIVSTNNNRQMFSEDDKNLLGFLSPKVGSGPRMLAAYRNYHEPGGGDVSDEIKTALEHGLTVILDLSSAHPAILEYFSKKYTRDIFNMQEEKFVGGPENPSGEANYIQLYIEEAHEIFPDNNNQAFGRNTQSSEFDIYMRIAKEGAKFRIGMIYSTQSVTMINRELLAQTENFFISHMSSSYETDALVKNNIMFENHVSDILRSRTVGYLRMMTRSHRFVIPVQIRRF